MSVRRAILLAYLLALSLPIYWLANMSFMTNTEITSGASLWPHAPTLANYARILADPSWYSGYINSPTYAVINTVLSLACALPAVSALPFFNLYSAVGLFDTPWATALAPRCLFNVPLAVWLLEGFMSAAPREIDETVQIDGCSFPRFFGRIFLPLVANGIGVAAFFCFMFSWVELPLARTLAPVNAKPIAAIMTRTISAAGMKLGYQDVGSWTMLKSAPLDRRRTAS